MIWRLAKIDGIPVTSFLYFNSTGTLPLVLFLNWFHCVLFCKYPWFMVTVAWQHETTLSADMVHNHEAELEPKSVPWDLNQVGQVGTLSFTSFRQQVLWTNFF